MKVLFTADLHIKLTAKNVPKEFSINRYRMLSKQFLELEKHVDLHVWGGDIFDKLPTLDELAIFFEMVQKSSVPTILFDGNHEATKKNQTFFTSLKDVIEALNPLVSVVTEITEYDDFTILPYCKLHTKNSIEQCNYDKPLYTHVRGEIPPHVKPEVDLDRFSKFPVVYAGDLHSHSNSQKNIVYPGSPVTTGFHRNHVETGYLVIEGAKWVWKPFDRLPQLIRKTVEDPKEMVPSDFDHTIYELEGDLVSLGSVANSSLLDKKVLKRNHEPTIFLKDMSIEEELGLYLTQVLNLDKSTIEQVRKVFNDYNTKA